MKTFIENKNRCPEDYRDMTRVQAFPTRAFFRKNRANLSIFKKYLAPNWRSVKCDFLIHSNLLF